MNTHTYNQHIEQLNEIPLEMQRILHEIREKDKRLLQLTLEIDSNREYLLDRLSKVKNNLTNKEKLKLK